MSEVDALLAQARADYAARLPAKVTAIEELVARAAWDEARRAAHKLRGSAATYGFAALGLAAGVLEERLARVVEAGPAAVVPQARAALQGVRAEADRVAASP